MKKLILSVFAVSAMILTANAQTSPVYKQISGSQSLEVLFAPLGGSPIGINGIKYRTFTAESTALRAQVFLGFNTNSDINTEIGFEGDEIELSANTSNFDISLAPGIEMHLNGTDRLSPYYGGELVLGFSSQTQKNEDLVPVFNDVFVQTDEEIYTTTTKNGSLSVGLNAIAGTDFYFAENIYLGAEMGFGVLFTTDFDTTTNSDAPDFEEVTTPNGSSLNIGPNVVGMIRLGVIF